MKSFLLAAIVAIAAPAFAADEKAPVAAADKINTVCPLDGKAADGKTVAEVGEKKVKVAVCCKDCQAAVAKAKAEDVLAAAKANKAIEKAK